MLMMLIKLALRTVHGLVDKLGQLIHLRQRLITQVNQPPYGFIRWAPQKSERFDCCCGRMSEFDSEFIGLNHRDEFVVTEGMPIMLILDIDFLERE